jgi:hypothetical protein
MVYGKVFVFTIRKNQMKTSECFLIKYPNACIACWYTTLYQVESYSTNVVRSNLSQAMCITYTIM